MHHPDAFIPAVMGVQGCLNFFLPADEQQFGQGGNRSQGLGGTANQRATAMVTAHDIKCDPHKSKERSRDRFPNRAPRMSF